MVSDFLIRKGLLCIYYVFHADSPFSSPIHLTVYTQYSSQQERSAGEAALSTFPFQENDTISPGLKRETAFSCSIPQATRASRKRGAAGSEIMFFSRRRKRGGGWRHCHAGGGGGETPALSHLGPSPWGQREGGGRNRENGLFGRGQEHGEDIRPLLPGKKQRHAAAHSICGTIGVFDFNKSREIFILPARNYVRKNSSRVSVHLGLIIQLIALDTNTEKG